MEPIYEVGKGKSEFLKVFPGWVRIRNPKPVNPFTKPIVGIIKFALEEIDILPQKYLDGCISFDQIDRIEVRYATKHAAGIIQFYIQGIHQTKANYANLAYRTDAMNFGIKDNETVKAAIAYIQEKKASSALPILLLRMREITKIYVITPTLNRELNVRSLILHEELMEYFVSTLEEIFLESSWKKYTIDEHKLALESGNELLTFSAVWDEAVEWESKGVIYAMDEESAAKVLALIIILKQRLNETTLV